MKLAEAGGYTRGQVGFFEVLSTSGKHTFWVYGELIRLIPTCASCVFGMVTTPLGTGLYRIV